MASEQSLQVQDKKELATREEKTVPLRYYVPSTDIHESEDALIIVMEMPGVDRKDVEVRIEEDVLRVEGRIELSKYSGLEPLYTEYGVGHYARNFSLSNRIDKDGVDARLDDGILTLTLKKVKEAMPRRISVA